MRKPTKLELPEGNRIFLESVIKIRTHQAQLVQRARILLLKHAGLSLKAIFNSSRLNKATSFDLSIGTLFFLLP